MKNRLDFAVQRDGVWIPIASMGIAATDLKDLIAQIPAIRSSLEKGRDKESHDVTLACPIVRPSKIIGIGLNYVDHAREMGLDIPEVPLVFSKFANSLIGPFDPIVVDTKLTSMTDYECELAVVIGRDGRQISYDAALQYVFAYTVANDITARDWQFRDIQVSRAKSFDTFCPACVRPFDPIPQRIKQHLIPPRTLG